MKQTPSPQDADSPDTPKPASKRQKLAAERQAMVLEMEELKTEKVRRQLEDFKKQEFEQVLSQKKITTQPLAPPTVAPARTRFRHVFSFLLLIGVIGGPILTSSWYLWARAHDRYVSYTGFSVRTEEIGSALELLGGVAEFSGSSSSDTNIIYKFIKSPELVHAVNEEINLRAIWSVPGADWSDAGTDPVFSYNPTGGPLGITGQGSPISILARKKSKDSIEDLTRYWNRMINVYSDSGTGLIDLEVQAFRPKDAQRIAEAIYRKSSEMINRLSSIAREDATSYARQELEAAVSRLKSARAELTKFRNRTQIVDPSASIQSQVGLLGSLQGQLAQSLIDLDIIRQTTRPNDPRITQMERRVEVIEARIGQERLKLGIGSNGTQSDQDAFANLVGEYEELSVDLQFAEQSYTAALTTYDAALAEAQRQSRYLAAHVHPTLPEQGTRPNRLSTMSLITLFSFLIWATLILIIYALKDRR